MIKSVNTSISEGLNSLIPPLTLKHRELSVTDVGTALTVGNQFVFVDVQNDSKEDLYIVVGLTTPSIDPNAGAIHLKQNESLELFRQQIPNNTSAIAFQTLTAKVATVRILYGEE